MSIIEAKLARSKTRSVAFLSIVGTVFVPFATVAGILNMNNDYAPEGSKFWIFWAVSLPLTVILLTLYGMYSRGLSMLFWNDQKADIRNGVRRVVSSDETELL